jgi:hypothetical protein
MYGASARNGPRWYVRRAVRVRRTHAVLVAAGVALLAGCGGGDRQDEDEPEGDFAVEVTRATFPKQQRLAQSSNLEITVRNAGDRTIPDIAVTIEGFDFRESDPTLSDPDRPQFVVNGEPREIGGFPEAKNAAPLGCETAYVNTWACGSLKPGKERSFRWGVTAVKAGPYEIVWRVAAGLDKAKAVGEGGVPPRGKFFGTVSDEVPEVRVGDDGRTVVESDR